MPLPILPSPTTPTFFSPTIHPYERTEKSIQRFSRNPSVAALLGQAASLPALRRVTFSSCNRAPGNGCYFNGPRFGAVARPMHCAGTRCGRNPSPRRFSTPIRKWHRPDGTTLTFPTRATRKESGSDPYGLIGQFKLPTQNTQWTQRSAAKWIFGHWKNRASGQHRPIHSARAPVALITLPYFSYSSRI
jgi:hypothetical protein